MITWKRGTGHWLGASALGLALSAAAGGCGSDTPVGGLTNPNPGSVVDRDKGAMRDDLPVPDLNAGQKEPIAEAASSSPSSTGTAAGTGGPGGGQPGASSSDPRRDAPEAASSAPATPPAEKNTGSAAGATKPAGPIKEGNPTSPQ